MTDELKAYEDLIRYKADKYDKLKDAVEKIKKEIESNNIYDWLSTQSVLDIIKKHTEGLL